MDSSVIEGMRTKQFPVDIWTTREHLCLTSAVSQAGDKNWGAVSKTIQQLTTEKSRPQDWYSTRNCALQYAKLLEQAEAPKKKKEREQPLPNESIQQYLLKMLSKKRTEELKEILEEEKAAYNKLRKEILLLESNQLDNKLHLYWNEMLKEQEQEEDEHSRLRAFLREREEKILLAAKAQTIKISTPSSPKPKAQQALFPKVSPTSELAANNAPEIKNEPDEKEKVPKVEDTFAKEATIKFPSQNLLSNLFPPDGDTGQKKENQRPSEKEFPLEVKQVEEEEEVIKLPEDGFDAGKCDTSFETNLPLDYTSNLTVEMREDEQEVSHEVLKKIDDTADTSVDNVDEEEEEGEKESLPLEESSSESKSSVQRHQENKIKEQSIKEFDPKVDEVNKDVDDEEESNKEAKREVKKEEDEDHEEEEEDEDDDVDKKKGEEKESRKQKWRNKNLPLFNFSKEPKMRSFAESDHYSLIKKDDSEISYEGELQKVTEDAADVDETSAAEFQMDKEEDKKFKKEVKDEYEFDDDASRESTDVNFSVSRDYTYSRCDRRKFSLSENVSSPVISESTPSSPASTNYGDDPEMEKLHRSWKRSIMLIWNDIAAHKNASLFLKPISEDKVPGYHSIVHRPLDLMSIKKNVENGTIRSTFDFQRDVMLMLMNAKMYNRRDHNIYRMADHMLNDAVETIEEFIQAQMLAKVVESPQKTLRRETRESSAKRVGDDVKRKRDDKEDKPAKRRKT